MAEAGASADEIAAAMKTALGATVRSPEIAEELTKAMAKSMALAGASGAEIAAAMKVGLFYICVKCVIMNSTIQPYLIFRRPWRPTRTSPRRRPRSC